MSWMPPLNSEHDFVELRRFERFQEVKVNVRQHQPEVAHLRRQMPAAVVEGRDRADPVVGVADRRAEVL